MDLSEGTSYADFFLNLADDLVVWRVGDKAIAFVELRWPRKWLFLLDFTVTAPISSIVAAIFGRC